MSAITGERWAECEEMVLPTDGAQAWAGLLLVVASGGVSLPALGWLAVEIGRLLIR